jgi:hypothetical protein
MTPIYLEPKPEPYLVHHLESSHSNAPDNGTTHPSTVGGSPSLSLPLTAAKHEGSMKMEEPTTVAVKNDDLSHARSTTATISNNHELTNMQPAPPSSYNPYSPIQYNGVGV